MTKKNYIYFLKSISIVAVIIIHILAGVLAWQHGFTFQILTLLRVIVGFAVPIFFMCSGAVLLDRDINYKYYIIRTLKILFFVAILYEIYDIIFLSKSIKSSLVDLIMFKHHFHLYFLNVMILIYILFPILRFFVSNASRKLLEYALLIWCFTAIILPTLYQFYPFSQLTGTPQQLMISVAYGRVGYFVFGYYLDKYKPINNINNNKNIYLCILISIISIAVATCGIILMSTQDAKNFYFLDGMSIPIALYSTSIFIIAQNLKYSNKKLVKIIELTASLSLNIYLYHDFFNIIFRKILPQTNPIIHLICLFICVTISSFILAYILNLKKLKNFNI